MGGGSTNNLIRQLMVVSGQTLYCSQQHLWLRFLRREASTDRNSLEDAHRHNDRRILTKTGQTSLAASPSSVTGSTAALAASSFWWQVQVGLTERGLENIGDITAIESLVEGAAAAAQTTTNTQTTTTTTNVPRVERDAALVQIQWEAHRITTADELYHTQWDTLAVTTTIRSPLAGRLTRVFVGNTTDYHDFDTEDPLFELGIDDEKTMDDATSTTNTTPLTIGNNKNNTSDTDGDGSGVPELVDWKTYQQRIHNLERGKFYDEDIR